MLADLAVSDGLKNWSSPRSKMLLVKKTLIQDAVHGPIRVDPRLFCIIDTPEFQRMRWIHQLGPIFLVYPTACHKRFSHSIGTYHVAKTLLENIYRQQRPQNLTRRIIFLVSTAALVHDIGHGPFSHAFEHVLRGLFSGKEVPDHEKMGANILDFMWKKYDAIRKEYSWKDMELIKALMEPQLPEHNALKNQYKKLGLLWIFSIISGPVDVDKLDYIYRDG